MLKTQNSHKFALYFMSVYVCDNAATAVLMLGYKYIGVAA